MLIADPAVGVLSLASTADSGRLSWLIILAIVCAMFVVCLTIVVRGNRAASRGTKYKQWRVQRARRGLWVLGALICLTIARIITGTQ